jgi:hypothetical protein
VISNLMSYQVMNIKRNKRQLRGVPPATRQPDP